MNSKRLSSKIKQKYLKKMNSYRQVETKLLEQQTKKMEQKLSLLKQQVEEQKKLKSSANYQSTLTRWRKNVQTQAPLKDYAKKILEDQKQAYAKYDINQKRITGKKSFEPVMKKMKEEKFEKEQKQGLKIPSFQTKVQEEREKPVISIENNFFKAKIETKKLIKQKTLEEFLEENFLQQYLPILQQHNIKQLEDLYHTNRDKMRDMGIKPGHQAKILKRIEEQFEGKKDKEENNAQKEKVKVENGYGDGNVNDYKEQQQQRIPSEHQHPDNFPNDEQNNSSSEQQQQYQDEVALLTVPQFAEVSLQTTEQELKQPATEYNCFQCYSKHKNTPTSSTDGRLFCCEACLCKYLQFMEKTCPECGEKFYKFDGYFQEGLWFCSLKCLPTKDQLEQMFLSWVHNNQ